MKDERREEGSKGRRKGGNKERRKEGSILDSRERGYIKVMRIQ